MDVNDVNNRPIFSIKIDDSEILFQIESQENELVLKKNFTCEDVKLLSDKERSKIFDEKSEKRPPKN